MKKVLLRNISIILLTILVIFMVMPLYSMADVPKEIDPSAWKPDDLNTGDVEALTSSATTIVSYIRYIGIIVTIVALIILGIKYMVGSIEERAEYKKSMKAFLIGVIVFFALSQLIAVIIDLSDSLGS